MNIQSVVDSNHIDVGIAYKIARKYLRRKYVCGLSIGTGLKNGAKRDGICICIHVNNKIDEKDLRQSSIFPKFINNIQVDVIISKEFSAQVTELESIRRRVKPANPVSPGVQLKSAVDIATLGMFVVSSNFPQKIYTLTAGHLIDGNNVKLYQPNNNGSEYCTVIKKVINSNCDCAIAEIVDLNRAITNRPMDGTRSISNYRFVNYDEVAEKSGAMTGITQAKVDYIGEHEIVYKNGVKQMMKGFLLVPLNDDPIKIISRSGDSGAIWYSAQTGEALGVNVAGDGGPTPWAFACHIEAALLSLQVQIY